MGWATITLNAFALASLEVLQLLRVMGKSPAWPLSMTSDIDACGCRLLLEGENQVKFWMGVGSGIVVASILGGYGLKVLLFPRSLI
uniref:Uncharacterized protein n=2 Tax=Oryza TaxID=4527 RepID=Q339X3_ORYSJ|nr:hypothetical protein LOC_Os10g17640 [Oryza sativa Japonica Group]